MAFFSSNTRVAEHCTRLVCLGVTPLATCTLPVGVYTFT